MGRKKSEKSARSEDPIENESEAYQPTGNFQADFSELCKEMEMSRPPPVFLRPKRPSSPVQVEHPQAPVAKGKGKEDKKASVIQLIPEPEEETPEEKAVIEQFGFKPKSFTVKNYLDLMRPCVHVDMESPDKPDSVTEVFAKNWRLELPMLRTLGRCFEKLHRLHTINFWRIAADAPVIKAMGEMLRHLDSVKTLSLESNSPVPEENYSELVRVESNLTRLQLRFNRITDIGAAKLAEQLRGLRDPPSKLVSLDLSSNCVADDGAAALAQALRTNRTLIHLSLSNNKIKDKGAAALAQVCSRFFLTHEETVERRKLMSIDRRSGASVSLSFVTDASSELGGVLHQTAGSHGTFHSQSVSSSSFGGGGGGGSGGAHLPPPSRRAADRPGSVRSQEKADKKAATGAGGKTAAGPAAAKGKKEEKPKPDEKAKAKGAAQKEDPKAKGKATPGPEKDAKGAPVKSGKAKGSRVKVSTPQMDPEPELQINSEHPLLERADVTYAPGYLLVPGNYVLALLNLSRNDITDQGIQEWKTAIKYQAAYMAKQKVNGTGLLKLMVQGNPFSAESEAYQALEQVMSTRDPLRATAGNSSGAE